MRANTLSAFRLTYDAALTQSQKQFKKEKDKEVAEEELNVAKQRL